MNNSEKVFNEVYQKYKVNLENIDVPNKKLLICYAAVPASGKTAISVILEKRLKGIRINAGDVQMLLEKYRGEQFYEGFIQEKRAFVYWLMQKVVDEFSNKFIILDKSIDRSYDEVLQWSKKNDVPMIVVSLEVSKKELEKRLIEREGSYAKNYLNDLDRWIREHEEFKKTDKHNLIFNTEDNSAEEIVVSIEEYIKNI